MRPLISVIIPIYKVEKYLHKCIDSILNQTYSNLEIILVDDGSPDKCGKICDEYADKDNRIMVIHKENGGLSDARNAGLKICKGAYIVFVDSDDWMELNGIEYLYKLSVEYSADVVIGGVQKIDNETSNVMWSSISRNQEKFVIYNREDAIKDFLLNGCASWARLYKRNVHCNIFFPVGEINEDEAIVIKLYEQCERILRIDQIVYNYRYRSNSITTSSWNKKKMDWYFHCKDNLEFVSENYPELREYALYRYCTSIIWCLNNMTYHTKKFRKEIEYLRIELKRSFKKKLRMTFFNKKEIIRIVLLIYCYYLYAFMIKVLNKQYT